jgi:predicted nucleic acid-binding protein
MSNFIVIFDACVLYPAPLRDFLMHLALMDLFRAKWTQQIHEEWISNLLKNRKDLTREKLERTKALMNEAAQECLVENYETLIPGLKLPDPDDRHVLAAAIKGGAALIVTFNFEDFPNSTLKQYDINSLYRGYTRSCVVRRPRRAELRCAAA